MGVVVPEGMIVSLREATTTVCKVNGDRLADKDVAR